MIQFDMSMVIEKLNERLAIPGAAHFEPGCGGLTSIVLQTAKAQSRVYLHGAHVSEYQAPSAHPILWTSARSRYEKGVPIRGGVPICFPWFAQNLDAPDAPMHGFARTHLWKVRRLVRNDDQSLELELGLAWTPRTKILWSGAFEITQTIRLDATDVGGLSMALQVRNHGRRAMTFEMALHSYLAVGDIRQVELSGLVGKTYIDKTDNLSRKTQNDKLIGFQSETDRVYLNSSGPCQIHDPTFGRSILLQKKGSNSTVVWNPWIDKAQRMEDFGDDEWIGMVCVETANVAENAVTLDRGASHTMSVRISVVDPFSSS